MKTLWKGLLVFQYAAAIWKREVSGNEIEKYAIYWAAPFRAAQLYIRFSIVCAEKRSPGGGKTRGSGTEKRCSRKWFHTIFPCTDSCTNTFCTSSPPTPPEGAANLKKAICVVRSDSIIGVTLQVLSLFEFKSVDLMLALEKSEKCSRCLQTHTPFTVGSR